MQLAVLPRRGRVDRGREEQPEVARRLAVHVEQTVLAMLDPLRLEMIAEDLHILERRRKHKVGLIACSLILSAFERKADTEGRWLDAQAIYRQLGGPDSSDVSFQDQVRKLLPLMQELQRRCLRELGGRVSSRKLRGRLSGFADVLIPDGCAFKVACALAGLYPGTGNAAELKLHAVHSLRANTAVTIGVSAGSMHDSDGFSPPVWQRDALYIWDLGYNSRKRFIDAALAGAQVLQRLKSSDSPRVLASYSSTGTRRQAILWGGGHPRLDQALAEGLVHRQRVLVLDVEIESGKRKVPARVVCVPCDGQDRYYLTTLSREIFTPHDVAELYRLRWEVELLFKDWKGVVHVDAVRQLKNPDSILVAVAASILAALLSRDIASELQAIAEHDLADDPEAGIGDTPPCATF